jgi:hypothetical protein
MPFLIREGFLFRFAGARRTDMAEYLDLARVSYRLRDDDNLHLGKIKAQLLKAVRIINAGIPQAIALIHTGDKVTVDGYLGIVVVG